MGIMDRHRRRPIGQRLPYLDAQLEHGGVQVGRISLLDPCIEKTACPDCDEKVYRILWRPETDETFLVVISGNLYVLHQCPQPVDPCQWPDEGDENVIT
jgi:hypothetical protein